MKMANVFIDTKENLDGKRISMFKTVIEKHRKNISHKLDIDMNKIYEAMELLLDCLKPKYANRFYFSEKEISTFIKANDDESIRKLSSYHYHFFGDDYVHLFGVEINHSNSGYEYTYHNIVDGIPIAFKTDGDKNIYKLKNMINDINSSIEAELRKILNKDSKYIDCINKALDDIKTQKAFQKTFNERLSKSDIVKKTAKKIKEFYKHTPLKIKAQNITMGYSEVVIGIIATIEPYVYDRCLSIEFKRDNIYLGQLILCDDGKHKFKPDFKNSKYFTNEVTSIKYMRTTFKKHLMMEGLSNEF